MAGIDMNRFDKLIKTEILSRTTLTTYNALRCTNKEFELLANDPYTKGLHTRRTATVSGFLLERFSPDLQLTYNYAPSRGSPTTIDLGFLPAESRILASSEHGLIVFQTPHPTWPHLMVYHVSKPAIKHYVSIPTPKTKYPTSSVSIVTMTSLPLRYKIARLSLSKARVSSSRVFWPVRMDVFDSSKWAWKKVEVLELPYGVVPVGFQPIVVSECVYTILSSNKILEFNAYSERLTILPPSHSIEPHHCHIRHSFQLLKIDHKLAAACRASDNTWKISIRSNDGSWRPQYQLDDQPWVYQPDLSFDNPSSKIALYYNIHLFFNGNVVDNCVATPYKLFVYKSDFEAVDLGGSE